MKINFLTAFPDFFRLISQISKNFRKCLENQEIRVEIINLRDFGKIDEKAFSGNGMIYQYDTLSHALENKKNVLLLSPDGTTLNQEILNEILMLPEITIVSARYEGIDARLIDEYIDFNISIGDYVVSNGEIAALVLIDALGRFSGTVKEKSLHDSFLNDRLDHDSFGPSQVSTQEVPKILKSGHHQKIEEWKKKYRLFKTIFLRPDLIQDLSPEEKEAIQEILQDVNRN